jgi:hypothetical protein
METSGRHGTDFKKGKTPVLSAEEMKARGKFL